ncbi:site-specific integrase, partial [Robertkochia sediminum]|uniref:site-specific integrase n=1 Tax=Robertkochia sediminum TaxID=2785326 RepID=UPI0019331F59
FLKKTQKVSDLELRAIESSFIIDFEHFLHQQPTLSNNGVMKHLERLKKLMKLAYEMDWLDKNIFKHHKLKFEKVDKAFLTRSELQKIMEFDPKRSSLAVTRDVFLFSCFTSLSYSDVRNLKRSNIVKGNDNKWWIKSKRAKTGVPLNIPLLPLPLEILQKYKDHPKVCSSDHVLPVCSNQKINNYLKEIASFTGIDKDFSFHMAR